MIRIYRLAVLFTSIFAFIPSVNAQQLSQADMQSKLVGNWVVSFKNPPPRNFVIKAVMPKADNSYVITGDYWVEGRSAEPFTDGEAASTPEGIQVKLTSFSGAQITATLRANGTFEGISKFNGRDIPFKVEKGTTAVGTAASDPASDPIRTFDGKWSGRASTTSSNCVPGAYEIDIKDGKISGTAAFFTVPNNCTSTVSGQVRRDNTAELRLMKQVSGCRNSRFAGKFDGNKFEASDAPPGRCQYDIILKKE